MKKIFTLLAAASLTASAFALPTPQKMELSKNAVLPQYSMEELRSDKFEHLQMPNGMQKIKDENTNTEYSLILAFNGPWWDLLAHPTIEGATAELQHFPFYQLLISFNAYDTQAYYQNYAVWPTYGAISDDCYVLGDDGKYIFSPEKAAEIYGEDKVGQPMTYEDYVEEAGEDGKLFVTLPGIYGRPCIPSFVGISGQNATNATGTQIYPVAATPNDDSSWNIANATTFTWVDCDADAAEISLTFDGKFNTENNAATPNTYLNLDLQGDAVLLGFANIHWDTVGEVHIFNGGRQEAGDEWTWNYTAFGSTPLNYYYLCFCDKTLTYGFVNDAGTAFDQANFTDTELPQNSLGTIGVPAGYTTEPYSFSWFAGALWAPENSEFPYGKWTLDVGDIENNWKPDEGGYVQTPEAYKLIDGYYRSSFGAQDGLHGSFEGYNQYGKGGNVEIGVGDKDYGFNFKIGTSLTGAYSIWGNFTEKPIYFHNEPDKWLSFKELPVKSNESYDAISSIIGGGSGVESVVEESNAPVVSRSFYNFQGQQLGSEPESGMYIIRAVKADGTVKATKVAK